MTTEDSVIQQKLKTNYSWRNYRQGQLSLCLPAGETKKATGEQTNGGCLLGQLVLIGGSRWELFIAEGILVVNDRNQSHFFNVSVCIELKNQGLFLNEFLPMMDQIFLYLFKKFTHQSSFSSGFPLKLWLPTFLRSVGSLELVGGERKGKQMTNLKVSFILPPPPNPSHRIQFSDQRLQYGEVKWSKICFVVLSTVFVSYVGLRLKCLTNENKDGSQFQPTPQGCYKCQYKSKVQCTLQILILTTFFKKIRCLHSDGS